jgi:hypothetical protein
MKLAALLSLVAHIPAASTHELQLRIGIQHLAVREPDLRQPVYARIDLSIGKVQNEMGEPTRDGHKEPKT